MDFQLSEDQLLIKARHYCAYQERCSFEVKNKLKELNAPSHIIPKIIGQLIEENFFNDERFCKLFARSKFKHLKWGKIKIQAALKQKMLPSNLIETGLAEISDDDYKNILIELYESKIRNKKNISYQEKIKAMQFLVSKGFEKEIIKTSLQAPNKSLF